MESKSLRYNEEKPKWSLVHYKSLEPMVRVLEMGAKKYSPDNWKIGLNRSEILESTMRHLTALMDGELLDKESGISHMAHIQCNAMFYNYHEDNSSFTEELSPKHRHDVSIHEAYSLRPGEESKTICRPYNHVSASTIAPTREDDGYKLQSVGLDIRAPKLADPDDDRGWSERKKATFKFFNEFPEPYKTQAKHNYQDSDNNSIPETAEAALGGGFSWVDTPEGDDHWAEFCQTLKNE
jgi:hypothetical protein